MFSGKIGTRSDSKSEFGLALFAPAAHQIVLDLEVIEYSRHDEIDEVLDALWAVIKTGIGRKDDCARAREFEHVLKALFEGSGTGLVIAILAFGVQLIKNIPATV